MEAMTSAMGMLQ